MATLHFTAHLRAVAPPGPLEVDAPTIAAALENAFDEFPRLRGYVLDDQGRIRRHVAVFVDGQMLDRSNALQAVVAPTSEIHVLQALSGG